MPGSAVAVGAATAELAIASAVIKAANIFRTEAERILYVHRFSRAEVSDPLRINNF
jgi:hypothetical protein